MYPDANVEDFKDVDFSSVESKTINKIYAYQDFYIFNMSVSGYSQGTTFLVSIDKNDLSIDKFIAISNGDTSGLGTQVLEEPFRSPWKEIQPMVNWIRFQGLRLLQVLLSMESMKRLVLWKA